VARRDDDEAYQVRLGAVLRRRDPPALRAFLEENAARYGDAGQVEAVRNQDDEEIEALLHRMILTRLDLADLHAESRRWLFERGLDSFGPRGRRRN